MNFKNTQKNVPKNDILNPLSRADWCEASKASAEIMLERFCNGKVIDFPFSK